jgi:hypothetical protein
VIRDDVVRAIRSIGHIWLTLAIPGEEFFHFTKAETESIVEPHGMTDNFRGKAMTLIAGCWYFHAAQSAKHELN